MINTCSLGYQCIINALSIHPRWTISALSVRCRTGGRSSKMSRAACSRHACCSLHKKALDQQPDRCSNMFLRAKCVSLKANMGLAFMWDVTSRKRDRWTSNPLREGNDDLCSHCNGGLACHWWWHIAQGDRRTGNPLGGMKACDHIVMGKVTDVPPNARW